MHRFRETGRLKGADARLPRSGQRRVVDPMVLTRRMRFRHPLPSVSMSPVSASCTLLRRQHAAVGWSQQRLGATTRPVARLGTGTREGLPLSRAAQLRPIARGRSRRHSCVPRRRRPRPASLARYITMSALRRSLAVVPSADSRVPVLALRSEPAAPTKKGRDIAAITLRHPPRACALASRWSGLSSSPAARRHPTRTERRMRSAAWLRT